MNEIGEYRKQIRKDIRRTATKTSLITIFIIIFVNVVAIIVSLILEKTGYWEVTPLSDMTTSMIIQFILCFPVCILFGKMLVKLPLRSLFSKLDAPTGKIIKWSVMFVGSAQFIGMVSNLIFNAIQTQTGTDLNEVTFLPNENIIDKVLMFVIIALVGPLLEELLFRGIMLTPHIRFGQMFAVVITGILFGLYHVNYVQIISAAIMGVAFGFLAVKTRSIIVPVIVHMINNSLGAIQYIALSYIDMDKLTEAEELILSGNSEKGTALMEPYLVPTMVTSMISISILLVGFVGLIMFIIEMARNRHEYSLGRENCDGVPAVQKVFAYVSSPATIVLLVMIVGLTVLNAVPTILTDLLGM